MENFTTQGKLDEILSAPNFKHFIYPTHFFFKRLKEEFLRTNRNGAPFVFIKIYVHQFELFSDWNKTSKAIHSWKLSVLSLLAEVKFIDCIGFLPNGGIGLILLNTDIDILNQIKKRLLKNLYRAKMLDILKFKTKNVIFEAFLHSGILNDKSENERIEEFNRKSTPFFKLSKLYFLDNILSDSIQRKLANRTKRFIDLFFTSMALLVLSPVFLVCALAVKLSDPKGPVIFKQIRVGKNGKHFTMYKFRSMYADAEERKKELEKFNETSGPTFKMKNDPRIYSFGRILRKFSLDELPQLINIIKGDMSIVGPRPPIPAEVEKYEPWHNMRLSVTPGLTCIWQVSGRSKISFEDWMRLDNRYVQKATIKDDMELIAKTFKIVLKGDGAY